MEVWLIKPNQFQKSLLINSYSVEMYIKYQLICLQFEKLKLTKFTGHFVLNFGNNSLIHKSDEEVQI